MRSALICVFFILIIREGSGAQGDDFRPTPIPLGDWHRDKQTGRAAGTLHEAIITDSPPTIAAVPAHYWEDALRHSVYLTLVRDKIDQLIAKADVISADSDPHKEVSKEVDDHNLWEKIKTAPFDRLKEEEPASFGDITIMAKGRLLEENGGFRFSEDDKGKEKCSEQQCMEGVIAIWSVKRVRQRDQETFPGRYHYELTFSVISQTPKKQKKPYENPIRTFTVRESPNPNVILARPQEYERKPVHVHGPRPNRAIWFHKNIVPTPTPVKTHRFDAFDRIFSLFSDDDDDIPYEPPAPKYRSNSYQHSKVGYAGAPTDQYPQVNVMHYPYRPQSNKFGRPPLSTPLPNQPPRQHFDIGSISALNSHSYYNPHDYRGESNLGSKTTRPAVLPTPLPPLSYKDQSSEVTNSVLFESFENATKHPEVAHPSYKTTNKYKPTPVKVNYFGDHVRPPIYNAPPGVFVTMDKKPFKPMPPMKLMHSSKPHKTNKPIDFRPSPQVLDTQFSEPDPFSDSAFRPISVNYSDRNTTENNFEFNKKPKNKHRPTGKKPSKKHENTKSHIITTSTPDIITAQTFTDEGLEGMDWMSYLGVFTKTTPMSSQTEKMNVTEYSTPISTTTMETINEMNSVNIITSPTMIPTLTTTRPKKRTRPPPKFTKQDKVKKLRRVLNSTTTTTIKPRTTKMTEKLIQRKAVQDLTPLASSALTGTPKSSWESKNVTLPFSTSTATATTSRTTTTTTTAAPTTTKESTTTRSTTTTTTTSKPSSTTYHPRNRNRFRQSTLLIKGTSVKHDKWSVIGLQKNNTNTTSASSSATQSSASYRRKGSNFQGYSSTVIPKDDLIEKQTDVSSESSTNYETIESNSVIPLDYSQNEDEDESGDNEENDEGENNDQSEFIFPATSSLTTDKTTEVTNFEAPFLTTDQNVQISNTSAHNKTKCKKKKNNSTAEEPTPVEQQIMKKSYNIQVTSENPTTNDIFQDFLNFDYLDDSDKSTKTASMKLDEQESANHGSYLKIHDDLNDFFGILNEKTERSESSPNDNDYDEDLGEFEDEGNREDGNESYEEEDTSYNDESRNNHESESKRPLSFLELIAMA